MMRKRTWIMAAAACGLMAAPTLADSLVLTGTVRDMKMSTTTGGHPDFEETVGTTALPAYGVINGLVSQALGSDSKPVYNPVRPASDDSMHSASLFNQWYNDTPGVNQSMTFSITLSNGGTAPGGTYTYNNQNFFPIDGLFWGNQGQNHNFSFTFELHTSFTYNTGQNFTFIGDDDVYVFINGQKVIDIGGVHSASNGNVILFNGNAYVTAANFPASSTVKTMTSTDLANFKTAWAAVSPSLGTCPITDTDHLPRHQPRPGLRPELPAGLLLRGAAHHGVHLPDSDEHPTAGDPAHGPQPLYD